MEYCNHRGLPDITMYGGDTTPWFITLEDENGSAMTPEAGDEYQCVLSVIPFGMSSGVGSYAMHTDPILQKTSDFRDNGDGVYQAKIAFVASDTITMRGKYIYQIEVQSSGSNKVNQGKLTVLANINRKA